MTGLAEDACSGVTAEPHDHVAAASDSSIAHPRPTSLRVSLLVIALLAVAAWTALILGVALSLLRTS